MSADIKYNVIYTRRRSITLIVSPDKGVVVRVPYRTSLRSIEKFVQEKSGWIKKHLEKYSVLTRLNHGKKYTEGEFHMFLGKEHKLKIAESVKDNASINDGYLYINVSDTMNTMRIKALIDKFYLQKAQEYLTIMFNEILGRFKERRFFPAGLFVKPLKSRWGSCTIKSRITISSELIKLDPKFAQYVIIHELCHLKHHNHGKEFYGLLTELVPDYKEIRKELRQYLIK
ncbi:MAG: SprT family zinc-dependent metalloprotease [Bacteroidia bacterium]|nr:SprT family zinc-dependent metalloprotease [Bacteroidia bacterium]